MIRVGLLGASRISVGAIIEAAASFDDVMVEGVAARDPARAAEFAATHGIPTVFDDYASMIASPDIDLVYNGLPPSHHKALSVDALRAGKPVLCEKPFAMNSAEAVEMVDAAEQTGSLLFEAFHYRFHPFFLRILEVVESGVLGTLESAHAHFNVPIRYTPTELRYRPDLGGGALMDLGVYPLHWLRMLLGPAPMVRDAASILSEHGVDLSTRGSLVFESGCVATFAASMEESLPDRLDAGIELVGSEGRLLAENPLAPHIGARLTWLDERETWPADSATTYVYQLAHVLSVLRGEQQALTGGTDAIETMRLVEAVRGAAGLGT